MRTRLPRTFGAFFGRFRRLTPIQAAALEPLLRGENVLLAAPTATGKTEAYMAPLLERLLADERGPLRLLVVSPTRALANDLKRRLEAPLDALQVSFGRYTGEHKERVGGRLPEVALTTPEALDALLARRPEALRALRAVVLDELHVLDTTPRGDQLRCLLVRLRRLASAGLQHVAATATAAAPAALAARYFDRARVLEAGRRRPIRAKFFFGGEPADLVEHLTRLAAAGARKILLFVNARTQVERLTTALLRRTPFRDAVFPHHGSLSRTVRERTERRFLEAPAAVAVATLTLELGIDIGSVDYVLLYGPPPSVAGLLQRIGRGSRRRTESRVGLICRRRDDEGIFRVQLERAARGDLCADGYAFRPGVLVQQALVLAGGRGYVTARRLRAVLPPDVQAAFPPSRLEALLRHLAEKAELLERHGERYVLTERTERGYATGRLHTNIAEPQALRVVDRLTGESLGVVDRDFAEAAPLVEVGGQTRHIRRRLEDRLLTDRGRGRGVSRFPVSTLAPVSFALGRAVAARAGLGPREVSQSPLGTRHLLLHGLGTAGALFLADLLRRHLGVTPLRLTPYTLVLPRPLEDLPRPTPADREAFLAAHEPRLARLLAMGPYHRHLPPSERRAAVAAAARLEDLARFLTTATLKTTPPS